MRAGWIIRALILCGLLTSGAPSAGAVMKNITFSGSSSGDLAAKPGESLELEIDESVAVTWDMPTFLAELAREQGVVADGEPLLDRIEALRIVARAFLETQERLLAVKDVDIRLDAAKAEGDSARVARLRQEWNDVANRYAGKGLEAIDAVAALDRELYDEVGMAMLEGEDYQPVVDVLNRRLNELGDELARRIDEGLDIDVTMRAHLISSAGARTPVHLDGHDDAVVGEPTPFPRAQVAVDERTRAELAAADGLADIARDVMDGTFVAEMNRALDQLQKSLRALKDKLRVDVLDRQLEALVEDLERASDEDLGPLIREAREVRSLLNSLTETPELESTTNADRLIEVYHLVLSAEDRLERLVESLPPAVTNLLDHVRALSAARSGLVREQVLVALREAKDGFIANQEYIKTLHASLKEIARALGLSNDLILEVEALPRRLGTGVSLDTRFDLQTIPAERHPGDRLIVRVEVRSEEGDAGAKSLAKGEQSFHLEAYGLYRELRGALLFVDPRGAIQRDLSFVPAPSLAVQWRLGLKRQAWWNRGLAPGLGIGLSMLDFEDASDFELGLAANLSILGDLLWLGYGRNLQAEADFAYVGINPLTLTGLARKAWQ